jgi:group I intron endonuclease
MADNIKDIPGVYLIRNIKNNKVYVGSSKRVLTRFKEHIRRLKGGYHPNIHLQSAFNKYGYDCFELSVITYCKVNESRTTEKLYIEQYRSDDRNYGYNKSGLTELGVIKHSDETLKRISKSKKNYYAHLSDEEKERLSASYKKGWSKVSKDERSVVAKNRWSNRNLQERDEHFTRIREQAYKKTRKPVECSNGMVFDGINEAARYFKVRHFTVQQLIVSGGKSRKLNGLSFKFLKEVSRG